MGLEPKDCCLQFQTVTALLHLKFSRMPLWTAWCSQFEGCTLHDSPTFRSSTALAPSRLETKPSKTSRRQLAGWVRFHSPRPVRVDFMLLLPPPALCTASLRAAFVAHSDAGSARAPSSDCCSHSHCCLFSLLPHDEFFGRMFFRKFCELVARLNIPNGVTFEIVRFFTAWNKC
jgi:hypothetical protein